MMPVRTVKMANRTMAGRMTARSTRRSSGETSQYQAQVDELDSDKGHQNAPEAIDEKIAAQEHGCTERPVLHALQRQRNEKHDYDCIENDGSKDRRERACEAHDVERIELRIGRGKGGGDNGEILGHIIGDAEGGQGTPRHQHLLAGLDDLDKLRG